MTPPPIPDELRDQLKNLPSAIEIPYNQSIVVKNDLPFTRPDFLGRGTVVETFITISDAAEFIEKLLAEKGQTHD